jgi:SAM-dependent methyltransferase
MLDAFKAAGLRAVGIEPSQRFLDFLSHRGHEVFESLEHMRRRHPERKFDRIVHFFVLEHVRHTEEFLREQLELLNPGGTIIAEVPCVLDPLTSVYRIPTFEKFYWSIAHHYYFSPESLSRVLRALPCTFEFAPEQRYDLSNHLVWMQEGKPGGQGRFKIFSEETLRSYAEDLKRSWRCDTFFVYITRRDG